MFIPYKKESPPNMKVVGLYLTEEMHEALRGKAKESGLKMSELARQMIDYCMGGEKDE